MSDEPTKPLTARPRRVLLKLSGEGFSRAGERGINMEEVLAIAKQTFQAAAGGVQIGIVIGGGNILRGAQFIAGSSGGIQEATAHYMGMLATVINGLALQDALENAGVSTRLQTAIRMEGVAEPFIRRRAIRHLEKGRVVIFAAGTGNPCVTTDTGAALRAAEIRADALLKATKVDGVFTSDPATDPKATLIANISYNEVIDRRLEVMDVSAIDLCQRSGIPIVVLNFQKPGNMKAVVQGETIGTLIDAAGGK